MLGWGLWRKMLFLLIVISIKAIHGASNAMISIIQGSYYQIEKITNHTSIGRDWIKAWEWNGFKTLNMLYLVHFLLNWRSIFKQLFQKRWGTWLLWWHRNLLLGLLLNNSHKFFVVLFKLFFIWLLLLLTTLTWILCLKLASNSSWSNRCRW